MKSVFLYLTFILPVFLCACQGNGRYPHMQQGNWNVSMSDFEFIDIEGTRHLLKDVKGEHKLLIFYDPAGEQSQAEIAAMRHSSHLAKLIVAGKVKVLAICAAGDLNLWNTYKENIPAQWTNGFDVKGATRMKNHLAIHSFPALVLFNDKNELIKQVSGFNSLIYMLDK